MKNTPSRLEPTPANKESSALMTSPRTYSVQEIEQLVELLRHSPDMQPDRLAGMVELVRLLRHYEHMGAAEIERETINYIRSSQSK